MVLSLCPAFGAGAGEHHGVALRSRYRHLVKSKRDYNVEFLRALLAGNPDRFPFADIIVIRHFAFSFPH
jgi:hypothetical protein